MTSVRVAVQVEFAVSIEIAAVVHTGYSTGLARYWWLVAKFCPPWSRLDTLVLMHVPPRSRAAAEIRAQRSVVARRWTLPSQEFLHAEAPGGLILLTAGIVALILANSPAAMGFGHFWEIHWEIGLDRFVLAGDLRELVNDGLMTLFFFVAGLEIKREVVEGQLSSLKRAAFPVVAALGGMIIPALFYSMVNLGGNGARGWGIPMATDIAFSIGVLSLLGRRVPTEARTFLLALAIADDIGAIVVIAIFYSSGLHLAPILVAGGIWITILLMNRIGVRSVLVQFGMALAFWGSIRASGVHATIAGVILGLSTPIRPWFPLQTTSTSVHWLASKLERAVEADHPSRAEALVSQIEVLARESESPLDRRLRLFHPWSSWVILPLFALANSGVSLSFESLGAASQSAVTWGIVLGLLLGKPLGIIGFAWLVNRLGWASAPKGLQLRELIGVGIVAGIGFTVSLFVAALAFTDPAQVARAKVGVLLASILAGAIGYAFLRVGPVHLVLDRPDAEPD